LIEKFLERRIGGLERGLDNTKTKEEEEKEERSLLEVVAYAASVAQASQGCCCYQQNVGHRMAGY
jgi:hypothetical protein